MLTRRTPVSVLALVTIGACAGLAAGVVAGTAGGLGHSPLQAGFVLRLTVCE